jgi:hypothetical protein
MPSFVALIFEPQDAPRDPSAPNFLEYIGGYGAFAEAARDSITGGAALMGPSTATTIAVHGGKNGEIVLTDGPYAETKEFLGGFFVLECEDLDAAIAIAAQLPAAWRDGGRVEVRPSMPM